MSQEVKRAGFCLSEEDLALQQKYVSVRIPAGIATKHDLLATLDTGLSFPEYFGGNWDALWECICDLSWLEPVHVVVIHEDLPLKDSPLQLNVYLSILIDAIASWAKKTEHRLIVVFPRECEPVVRALVAAREAR